MSKRPQKEQAQAASRVTADISGLEAVNPILRHVAEQLAARRRIDFSLHIKIGSGSTAETIKTAAGAE